MRYYLNTRMCGIVALDDNDCADVPSLPIIFLRQNLKQVAAAWARMSNEFVSIKNIKLISPDPNEGD